MRTSAKALAWRVAPAEHQGHRPWQVAGGGCRVCVWAGALVPVRIVPAKEIPMRGQALVLCPTTKIRNPVALPASVDLCPATCNVQPCFLCFSVPTIHASVSGMIGGYDRGKEAGGVTAGTTSGRRRLGRWKLVVGAVRHEEDVGLWGWGRLLLPLSVRNWTRSR
jgi:hypothetical protein